MPLPKNKKNLKRRAFRPETSGNKEAEKEESLIVEQGAKDKHVVLNFDGADLNTVISAVGEMLGVNYILSPNVTGKSPYIPTRRSR